MQVSRSITMRNFQDSTSSQKISTLGVRSVSGQSQAFVEKKKQRAKLQFKKIKGLFSGGQFNGSSGYEEAAAQGLVAGINAAMSILGKEPLIIDRSDTALRTNRIRAAYL